MVTRHKPRHTDEKVRVAVDPDGIPAELKTYAHWVVHLDKEPYDPKTGQRASTTDSRTWATFPEALEAYEAGGWDGIGFVFSSGDPFVGLDYDECRNPKTGEIDPRVLKHIERFEDAVAVEVSTSASGVHLITRGKLRGGAKRGGYEVYGQERFFCLTGVPIDA